MKLILLCLLSVASSYLWAQEKKLLNYSYTKENVVASAMEGVWERTTVDSFIDNLKFTKDSTVLGSISEQYFETFKDFKVYHAGYMEVTRSSKKSSYPYFLTEYLGNPRVIFFRESDGNPIGDGESFNLFIARGEENYQDRLFVGGDFNNQSFDEFRRIDREGD